MLVFLRLKMMWRDPKVMLNTAIKVPHHLYMFERAALCAAPTIIYSYKIIDWYIGYIDSAVVFLILR